MAEDVWNRKSVRYKRVEDDEKIKARLVRRYQNDELTIFEQSLLDSRDARLLHEDALCDISEQFLAHPERLQQFALLELARKFFKVLTGLNLIENSLFLYGDMLNVLLETCRVYNSIMEVRNIFRRNFKGISKCESKILGFV